MNASIQGIIDHLFRDTVDNAETRALHEELLNNCLEHYNDLISRGMSETEAIDAVVESLKGMKEVIDEYPKKPGAESAQEKEAQPAAAAPEVRTAEPAKEGAGASAPVQEIPSEYTFSAAEIRRLRTDLKNSDLKIGRSQDARIHVRCEDMEQLICRQDGDRLTVRMADKAKQSMEEAAKQINGTDFSLKGLMNFIGKTIGSAVSSITVSWKVSIDLPETLQEMDLNAKSGDVEIQAALPEVLMIHTMSGDAEVKACGGNAARKISISAMSGEIELEGHADEIVLSSMSGDVEAKGSYRRAELKSTSGDAELKGCAEQVILHSVSGDAEAQMRSAAVRSIDARSTSGDVRIQLAPGTDSVHVNMSTVSGSASSTVVEYGSNAALQINAASVSGDVRVQ